MTSILDDIDSTLYNGDLTLIKEKIFKRCNGQNIGTLELIDIYTLVRQLDIPFSDIDWLIENSLCIEIPRAIKNVPSLKGCTFGERTPETIFPKISNLALCKEYMKDKEQFCKEQCNGLAYYEYDTKTRDSIDHFILSCYLSFSPELEFDYLDYKKENIIKNRSHINFEDLLGNNWWSSKNNTYAPYKVTDDIVYCPDTLTSGGVYIDAKGDLAFTGSTDLAGKCSK